MSKKIDHDSIMWIHLACFRKFLLDSKKDGESCFNYTKTAFKEQSIPQTILIEFYEFCIWNNQLDTAKFIIQYIDIDKQVNLSIRIHQ